MFTMVRHGAQLRTRPVACRKPCVCCDTLSLLAIGNLFVFVKGLTQKACVVAMLLEWSLRSQFQSSSALLACKARNCCSNAQCQSTCTPAIERLDVLGHPG